MGMRQLTFTLALALLVAPGARAEEAGGLAAVKTWFANWKSALERSAVEGRYRRLRTATAVAAVRGAGQEAADPSKPYWKGGWSEKRSAERQKERAELASAVQLILDGKTAEARAALDAFEKAHPASSFKDDVAAGRAKLEELEKAAAPKPEPAPAAAPAAPAAPAEPPKAEAPTAPPAAPPAEAPKPAQP